VVAADVVADVVNDVGSDSGAGSGAWFVDVGVVAAVVEGGSVGVVAADTVVAAI